MLEKGWLYRGADVMPWCPRCATAISQHEIVTDGYAELTHPSCDFALSSAMIGENESLLVWTTTPWTLTSNVAAAVGPDLTYAKVRQGDEVLYLSKGTLYILLGDYKVLAELKGAEMDGWTYDGPFDDLPAAQNHRRIDTDLKNCGRCRTHSRSSPPGDMWDEVGEAEGTGIVHIAPGCGAEDFELGREHKFPMIAPLDDEGILCGRF